MKEKTDTQQPEPITVTQEQAGKILDLGKDNIKKLLVSGRLRSIRVGSRILIPRFELDNFLKREMAEERDK